jgi:hypothetical protein
MLNIILLLKPSSNVNRAWLIDWLSRRIELLQWWELSTSLIHHLRFKFLSLNQTICAEWKRLSAFWIIIICWILPLFCFRRCFFETILRYISAKWCLTYRLEISIGIVPRTLDRHCFHSQFTHTAPFIIRMSIMWPRG